MLSFSILWSLYFYSCILKSRWPSNLRRQIQVLVVVRESVGSNLTVDSLRCTNFLCLIGHISCVKKLIIHLTKRYKRLHSQIVSWRRKHSERKWHVYNWRTISLITFCSKREIRCVVILYKDLCASFEMNQKMKKESDVRE